MTTNQKVSIRDDAVEVECECNWEYERNPCDKESAHYGGEDDGYVLADWKVTNGIQLNGYEETEVDDELHRQGPDE